MAPKTLTPKEIALEWESDARTVRKFLRKDAENKGLENPGKGSRWAIEARKLKSLRKGFDAWVAANAAKAEEADEATDAPEVTETVNDDATTDDTATNDEGDEVLEDDEVPEDDDALEGDIG